MNLSKFGEKFTREAGITQLMDDLGAAMAKGDMLMLGGGNPAHIPDVQDHFRKRMMDLLSTPHGFETMIGNYDGSRGNAAFIEALSGLLRDTLGWEISPKNIALTNGSQNAFFFVSENPMKRDELLDELEASWKEIDATIPKAPNPKRKRK